MAHLPGSPPRPSGVKYTRSHLSTSTVPASVGANGTNSSSESESDAPTPWASRARSNSFTLDSLPIEAGSSTDDSDGEDPELAYRQEGTGLGLAAPAHKLQHRAPDVSLTAPSSRRRSISSSVTRRTVESPVAGPSGARLSSHGLPSHPTSPTRRGPDSARRTSHRLSSEQLRQTSSSHSSRAASVKTDASVDGKGKSREREHSSGPYALPVTHDPLNPLSALSGSRLSSFASGLSLSAASVAASEGDRVGGSVRRSRTARRPISSIANDHSHTAPSEPYSIGSTIPDPIAEQSRETSPNRPTSIDSHSTTATSSSRLAPSTSSGPTAATVEPSLQDLLSQVNLNDAFKLVSTLQTAQNTPKPAPPPTPNSASSFAQQQATNAPIAVQPAIVRRQNRLSTSSSQHFSEGSNGRACAESSPGEVNPSGGAPPPVTGVTVTATGSKDAGRRKSLSLSFGVGSAKRERTGSIASRKDFVPYAAEKTLVHFDASDLADLAKHVEEEISRVHRGLTTATTDRKNAAIVYLNLRYQPLFAALAQPPEQGTKVANALDVVHWREEKKRLEARSNGGSRSGISTHSSTRLSNHPRKKYEYGERRRDPPSLWEVYPDEIQEYVKVGGKIEKEDEPALVPTSSNASERQLDNLFAGGGSLRNGISRVTTKSTASSSRGSQQGVAQGPSEPPAPPGPSASPGPAASPVTSTMSDKHFGVHLLTGRPGHSRENSYEGSPLARSQRGGRSVRSRSSSIVDAHDAALAGTCLLHPVSSIGSAGSVPSKQPSPQPMAPGELSNSPYNFDAFTSPQQRAAFSSASLDAPASPTMSPHVRRELLGSPLLSPRAGGPRRESTYDGLRRGIARFTGLGANTDVEGSDGGSGHSRKKTVDGEIAYGSDSDIRSPGGRNSAFRSRSRFAHGVSGHSSDHGPKKARTKMVSQRLFSNETDENPSSGAEDGPSRWIGASRAFWGSHRYGRSRTNVADAHGTNGLSLRPGRSIARRRANSGHLSSGEEDALSQGATLDVSEEEFVKLVAVERQVKGQLALIESFLPRVPIILNEFLEGLSSRKESTIDQTGIEVAYSFPRLPGAILADIASAKVANGPHIVPTVEEVTETSTNTSSATSSSDTGEDQSKHYPNRPKQKKASTYAGLSTAGPTDDLALKSRAQLRHVTNPAVRRLQMRPRSMTIGDPMLGLSGPVSHPLGYEDERLTQQRVVDPLLKLEVLLAELERDCTQVESRVSEVSAEQTRIRSEIERGKHETDALNSLVASQLEPQFSSLAEKVRRTKDAAERPDEGMADALGRAGEIVLTLVKFSFQLLSIVWLVAGWLVGRFSAKKEAKARRKWGGESSLLPASTFRMASAEVVDDLTADKD